MTAFDFFKEISKIPRGSGNEEAIADYLEKFAKDRGLYCLRDKFNNIFVRKPAAKGYENAPSVLLQGHTDMVCEKTPDSDHDFLKDEIKLVIKNGRVYADRTTLGADDGAGVTTMMAILDDKDFECGQIECLFTTSEETGMYGAFGFDYSNVQSEKMINLDSEEELNACIGCAGGMRCNASLPVEFTKLDGVPYKISVSGLVGGHSGTEIDKGRSSAIKIMAYTIDRLSTVCPVNLISIVGGGRDNVIPFTCDAYISVYNEDDTKKAETEIKAYKEILKDALSDGDKKHFALKMTKVKESDRGNLTKMLTFKSTSAVISALLLAPQGVTAETPDDHIVLASANLGTMELTDKSFDFGFLIRSGKPEFSDRTARQIDRLAKALGGTSEIESSYPGWDFITGGAMQNAYKEACLEVFGKEPIFTVIHAGLECGIMSTELKKYGKNPDIISIGPDVCEIHSPKENMDIESLERMVKIVKIILKKL